jgi:hypothetical protein
VKPAARKPVSKDAQSLGRRHSPRMILAVVALATFAVIFPLLRDRHGAPVAVEAAGSAPSVSQADGGSSGAEAAPAAPQAHESLAKPPPAKDLEVRPLFDRTERLTSGKPMKVRFSARAKSTGSPASSADVAVSVIHPGSPEQRIAAYEVEEGVYEATFTPRGVGQYRVALTSSDGTPIPGTPPVKLGVVGAVGGKDPTVTDITSSTSYDPLTTRSKGTGRGRHR